MAGPSTSRWLAVTLASIGDAVIATDARGRIDWLNPVAEELTGWSEREAWAARGRGLPDHRRADAADVEDPVEEVLRLPEPVGLAVQTMLVTLGGNERPSTTARHRSATR